MDKSHLELVFLVLNNLKDHFAMARKTYKSTKEKINLIC